MSNNIKVDMRKEVIGSCTVYNCDCMEYLAQVADKAFDVAIVDPPYFNGDKLLNYTQTRVTPYKKVNWTQPTKEYFDELFRVSKNQIIWGGNYFNLPPTRCFIVWDKGNQSKDRSFAECEYAWTSFDASARIFKFDSIRDPRVRFHPTQKPVELYKYTLYKFVSRDWSILDTHFGSGSLGVACNDMGYNLTALEIDEDYFDKSVVRLKSANAQMPLFDKFDKQDKRETAPCPHKRG